MRYGHVTILVLNLILNLSTEIEYVFVTRFCFAVLIAGIEDYDKQL